MSQLCLQVSLSTMLNLSEPVSPRGKQNGPDHKSGSLSTLTRGHSTEVLFNLTDRGDKETMEGPGEALLEVAGAMKRERGMASSVPPGSCGFLQNFYGQNSLLGNPHSSRGALRCLVKERKW